MTELDRELPEGYKMTEIGMIPEEWEVVNLSEVINLRRGVSWRKEEANREGIGIPVVGIPNIKENGSIDFSNTYFLNKNISEEKILRMNDILFVSSSGSIKNIGRNVLIREIPQNRFTYASFTFLGRVSSMKADSEYLFYLLNSRVVDFTKYARRASDGKYNFQLTQFKNEQKIPLPPLPEQRKIAAVLSTVQEAKEKTEAVISAARDLKKSMMSYLFTYGPVPLPDAENISQKETEIGMIPEEWEVVKLIEAVKKKSDIVGGPFGSNLKVSDYMDLGVPIIRLQNVERNRFINKDIKFISEKKAEELKYHSFTGGDIILAKLGNPIGKTCLVPSDLNYGIVTADVVRIRTCKDLTDKNYIVYALNSSFCEEQFGKAKTGTTRPRVNVSDVRNIKIPLPPLPEQEKIASMLSAIDEKIEAEENKKKALEDLFNTLLHNLMTARIRVNHLALDKAELAM